MKASKLGRGGGMDGLLRPMGHLPPHALLAVPPVAPRLPPQRRRHEVRRGRDPVRQWARNYGRRLTHETWLSGQERGAEHAPRVDGEGETSGGAARLRKVQAEEELGMAVRGRGEGRRAR